MTDSNKETPPEGGEANPTPEAPSVEALQKQIENLNKGIATYRKESKDAVTRADSIELKFTELQKEIEKGKKTTGEDDDLPPLSEQDAKRLEKWAKAQGYATKAELEEERHKIQGDTLKTIETQAIDDFVKQHPEYEKDEEWLKLKQEFGQYKQPTSLSEYNRILSKIHKELHPDDSKAKARAEIETRKRLSLGGKGGQQDENASELDKLMDKYPRLSREQIEQKLAEINQLYPKKDK